MSDSNKSTSGTPAMSKTNMPALSKSGMPAMTDDDAAAQFKKRTLVIILSVFAASLVVTVALTVLGTEVEDRSAGVDTFSVSVLGHRGLSELLTKLDIPVVLSRSDSGAKAKNGLLIIAEPAVTDDASRERLRVMISEAARVLVVLPKWYGQNERGKTWVSEADYIPEDEIKPVFSAIYLNDVELVRKASPTPFDDLGVVKGGVLPKIREPQLLKSNFIKPYMEASGEAGILVGEVDQTEVEQIVVLSDPDVINNWGLREPDNARFVIELIDQMRHGGPVVIDETLHGYARRPSLVRTLTTFPLVIATIQVLLTALLGVWAAMVRFGPKHSPPPPFTPGKDFLIRNTAALLHYGGHHADALRRYLATSVVDVRHVLHAPALVPTQLTAWLERVRLHRGGTISLVDLELKVTTASTPETYLEVADQIYRWRMEMTDGSRHRS